MPQLLAGPGVILGQPLAGRRLVEADDAAGMQLLEPRAGPGLDQFRRLGGDFSDGGVGEGIASGALSDAGLCAGSIAGGRDRRR